MVLLLGNYPPDQQQSMQRFTALMLRGLTERGIEAEVVNPQPLFGRVRFLGGFVGKWLGYVDKYILFPFQLRGRLRERPALVHICDHSNAVYVDKCGGVPVLVTCHDLLAVRGALGEDTDCPATFTGRFLQKWILRGLGHARAIVCVSDATASDAHRLLGQGGRPDISTIRLGLNYEYKQIPETVSRARLQESGIVHPDRAFIMHVGSDLSRKNRDGVLRIFERIHKQWDGDLVFVGEPLNPELRRRIADLGLGSRVKEVIDAPDSLLEALYNRAVALVYPSRSEGFGWPIIEAQACGCPVICSTVGPLRDVAGDAGLFHSVEDEAGFGTDVLRLTSPAQRANWSDKSLRNAQRFSTGKMLDEYTQLYTQIAGRG